MLPKTVKGIIYCHPAAFPNQQANTVHVMKMCSALAHAGIKVRLVGFRSWKRFFRSRSQLLRHYGCAHPFELHLVWNLERLWSKQDSMSTLFGLAEASLNDGDVIYTRDIRIASHFTGKGYDTVLELHHPPQAHEDVLRVLLKSKHLRLLVAITDRLRSELVRRYAPAVPMLVLPDGADVPLQARPGQRAAETTPVIIGYCGSFFPGKGVELVGELARRRPQLQFCVVGGGDVETKALRSRYQDCRNLRIHPRVAPAQVPEWLGGFDICLLPNQSSVKIRANLDIGEWTSPLKMFEYMAAGRPIIASDLPVLKEVLVRDRNALLCEPTDTDAWLAAIDKLAGDPMMRAAMGQHNLDDLLGKFSWRCRANTLMRGLSDGAEGSDLMGTIVNT